MKSVLLSFLALHAAAAQVATVDSWYAPIDFGTSQCEPADVDGDSFTDCVLLTDTSQAAVAYGAAEGDPSVTDVASAAGATVAKAGFAFGEAYIAIGGGAGIKVYTTDDNLLTSDSSMSVNDLVAADLNDDGIDEFVVGHDTAMAVVSVLDDAAFAYASDSAVTAVAVGDIDGDDTPDVLSCNDAGLTLYFNVAGDGALVAGDGVELEGPCTQLLVDDLDDDGSLDVVAVTASTVYVLGVAAGDTERPCADCLVTLHDADDDGFSDVVVSPEGTDLFVLLNDQDGGFGADEEALELLALSDSVLHVASDGEALFVTLDTGDLIVAVVEDVGCGEDSDCDDGSVCVDGGCLCGPGTFEGAFNSTGNDTCTVCDTDTYQPAAGMTECYSCGSAHSVTNTDDHTWCECVDANDYMTAVEGSDSFECSPWSEVCASVSVDDATTLLFENFTATADISGCLPALEDNADYWWELTAPFATEVTDEVVTYEPSLNTTFDEVGEWSVTLYVCSSDQTPDVDTCTDTSFTVTVTGGCDPGQEEDHTGVCVDCEAGTYSADGLACEPCDAGDFSYAAWDACVACPAGTSSAEGAATCTCDDASTVTVATDDEAYFECVTPVFTLAWNSAPLTGQLPVDALPYTYAADASYTLEPADKLADVTVDESFSTTTFDAYGEYTVTYTVGIADTAITASEDIAVVVNDAPVVNISAPTTVADTTFTIEVSCETQLGAAACADPAAFAFTFSPDSATIEVGDDASLWTVTAEPPLDDPQTYVITLAFADDFGAPASDVAETAVDAAEFSPVFTDSLMPTFSDWTELADSFTFAIGVSDADNEEPPTCAVSTTSEGADVSSDGGDCSAVSFTASGGPGQYAVDVIATDADGHTNSATFPVYVYEDDLLADVELTRPDTSATWTGVDPGVTVVSTLFSFSPENQAEGQVTAVDGTALTLQADVLDAYIGDIAVTAHLEMADHVRDLTAVLTTLPAQPEASISGPWGDNAFYAADMPASVSVSVDATIADGSVDAYAITVSAVDGGAVVASSSGSSSVLVADFDLDAPAEYAVEATVTSDQGETATASASFWLLPAIVLADPGQTVSAGDAGSFAVDVAPYSGDALSYAWTLPDASTSTDASPAWTFTAAGSAEAAAVTVTATVADVGAITADLTVSVDVLALPTAAISLLDDYLVVSDLPADVDFSVTSTVDDRTAVTTTSVVMQRVEDSAIVASTISASDSATLSFSATADLMSAEYTVTGVVTTDAGQTASDATTFWLLEALVLADAADVVVGVGGEAALSVAVASPSSYTDLSYEWTLPDGSSSSEASPALTWDEVGTFTAEVTVSANFDVFAVSPVTDTQTVTIQVLEAPTATLSAGWAEDADAPYFLAALPISDEAFVVDATTDARTSVSLVSAVVTTAAGAAVASASLTDGSDSATAVASFAANDEYTLTGTVETAAGQSVVVEENFWVLAELELADPALEYSLGTNDAAVTRQVEVSLVDSVYGSVQYAWSAPEGSPRFVESADDGSTLEVDTTDLTAPFVTFDADGTFDFDVTVTANVAGFSTSPVSASLTVQVTVLAGDTSVVVAQAAGPSELLTDRTETFQLSAAGSASSRSDDTLTYAWTAADDALFSFSSAAAAQPVVTVEGAVADATETEYSFTVVVTDELGNSDSATVAVSFDLYPTISLASVPATALLSDGGFDVSATLSDDVVSVVYSLVTPSGAVVEVDGLTPETLPVTEAGAHSLSAVATDDAGLESDPTASADVLVYADPTIAVATDTLFVTRPGENEDAVIEVTATVSDVIDAAADLVIAWTVDNADDATLANAGTDTVTLTSGVEGVYTLTATVTNTQDLSASVDVTVEVLPTTDTRVTAVIASVPLVVLDDGDSASLDASASSSSANPNDPVAAGLTYAWSGPEGLTFADATAATTTVSGVGGGEQVVELIVFDLNGKNGTASVTITGTHAPVIALDEDNYFYGASDELPESVAFDASGTTDPDGDAVTLSWAVDADCFGTTPSTSDDDAVLTFGALERGLCQATLTATDSYGASATATVQYQAVELTITSPNAFTTWYQGKTYDIEWTSYGFSAGLVEVFITISGYDELIMTIEGGADFSEDGAVGFTVPTDYSGVEFNSGFGETFSIEMRVIDGVNEDIVSTAEFLIYAAYSFSTTPWGTCEPDNGLCGVGSQARTYKCEDSEGVQVDDYFCLRYADEPAATRACLADTLCQEAEWYAPDFEGDCDTAETDAFGACGAGTRSRTVTCYYTTGSVDESGAACAALDEPAATEYCHAGTCQTFEYVVRSTQECSAECGGGSQALLYGCRNTRSGFWVPRVVCKNQGLITGSEPDSQPCNDDVVCPEYSWVYGTWTECSESCGTAGVKTVDYECQDADGAVVDDALCTDALVAERSCNRFPCTYYWYAPGKWSTECVFEDGATCGTGTQTRTVYCVGSDDPTFLNEDQTNCGGSMPTEQSCVEACSFCDTTSCSGNGVCVEDLQECTCNTGFEGTYCEVSQGCGDGVTVDGAGECCDTGVISPNTDLCCDVAGSVLDANGDCCESGTTDPCGVCCEGDACDVVTDLDAACCEASALDAQSLCCATNDVDACGVCGGDGVCATNVEASDGAVVPDCSDTLLDQLNVDALHVQYQSDMAALLRIQRSLVQIIDLVCSEDAAARLRLRRRLLADGSYVTSYKILPDADSSLDAFDVAAAVAANYSVTSVGAAGVCGNGICEVGEQCEADGSNAVSCCMQDCPLIAQECETPENGDGTQCGGHGSCVQSAGACECYTSQGYQGDACDECAVGFYAVGSGADFVCAVQIEAIEVVIDDDDFVDRDDVLRALAVAIPVGAIVFVLFSVIVKKKNVCGIRPVKRNHKPLFSDQVVRSQELTNI